MRKLINDIVQYSDAPEAIKSPALADTYTTTPFIITLDDTYDIDCIGVGYTDATEITINGDVITLDTIQRNRSGLYLLTSQINTGVLTVSHNGTYIGRFGAGLSRLLGAAPSREPGFYTTAKPRITASGQVIEGAGGISGRKQGVDFRYKIDRDIFADFEAAFESQISRGFPFFILFDKEFHRMPWLRMYGATNNELLFQSSVNFFSYSKRFEYIERF